MSSLALLHWDILITTCNHFWIRHGTCLTRNRNSSNEYIQQMRLTWMLLTQQIYWTPTLLHTVLVTREDDKPTVCLPGSLSPWGTVTEGWVGHRPGWGCACRQLSGAEGGGWWFLGPLHSSSDVGLSATACELLELCYKIINRRWLPSSQLEHLQHR